MLGPLDDSLLHQVPTTFDHAGTSDHRFFDRWAVGIQHPELSVIYGMAAYKNTNTFDGFCCVQRAGRQHNLRLSRSFRPLLGAMTLGPLCIEVIEPLRSHRVTLEAANGYPHSCDITWTGTLPPNEEHPHFSRSDGRAVQDYVRYDQLGVATGWVRIGDDRIEVGEWFAWRDHSWGVRPGAGGYDGSFQPRASPSSASPSSASPSSASPSSASPSSASPSSASPSSASPSSPGGSLFIWLAFRAGQVSGQFQTREDARGRLSIDGYIRPNANQPAATVAVTDIRHDISFVDGHTAFSRARLAVTTADGRTWDFDASALRAPWVFMGTGYSGGYNDGRGLGVARGDLLESDTYDVSRSADVGLPDGSSAQPWHRETDVALLVDGASGDGHLAIFAGPPVPPSTLPRSS